MQRGVSLKLETRRDTLQRQTVDPQRRLIAKPDLRTGCCCCYNIVKQPAGIMSRAEIHLEQPSAFQVRPSGAAADADGDPASDPFACQFLSLLPVVQAPPTLSSSTCYLAPPLAPLLIPPIIVLFASRSPHPSTSSLSLSLGQATSVELRDALRARTKQAQPRCKRLCGCALGVNGVLNLE